MAAKLHQLQIYITGNNEHTQWQFRCFLDCVNQVHKYIITANITEPHNSILPGTIFKGQIRNICQMFPFEAEGCQLVSKFFDKMDYIIIFNLCLATQSQFFQVLATIRNNAKYFPTYSLEKKTSLLLSLN